MSESKFQEWPTKHLDYLFTCHANRTEDEDLRYLAKQFFGYTKAAQYTDMSGKKHEVSFFDAPDFQQIMLLIKHLHETTQANIQQIKTLQTTISTQADQLYKAHDQVAQVAQVKKVLQQATDLAVAKTTQLTDALNTYGTHHHDCNFVEVVGCGRIISTVKEQTACTCGWAQVKEKLSKP